MITKNYKSLPNELICELHTLYITNLPDYANARIDVSKTGNHYLVLPFREPDNQYEIMVEISHERLKILNGRGMNLILPFKEPEKGFFYLARKNIENQIEGLFFIQPGEQEFDWPLPDTISIDFKLIEKVLPFDLFNYAIKRNRIAIKVRFEAPGLDDNMKVWVFKNFLIPFTDLIKSALLSNNLKINSRNIEEILNLGFSKIKHKCLEGILECDYSPNLLTMENTEFDNLQNLYLMFESENMEDIVNNLNKFENKKIIPQYIQLLRAIIRNDAKMFSAFATPEEEKKEIFLNRTKSINVKKIMESNLQSDPYEEVVIGVLTRIDFEQRKTPMFALQSTVTADKYCGKIADNLIPDMDSQTFNFRNMEYECTLQVRYTPESPLSKEKYDYTLLDISELTSNVETDYSSLQ